MVLHTQRKAFSMLTAIFVILLMGFVGAMVMSLSGKMVKETTTQFQREQAILLAKSYTEYAIMAVMANDRATVDCLDTINGHYGNFDIRVHIAYLSNTATDVSKCSNVLSNTIATLGSPLNIIVDVYVRYPDFDNSAMNMTYHKRTLQKI